MNCGTCKHWKPFDPMKYHEKNMAGFGRCERIGFADDDGIPLEQRSSWIACTVDGSGYFAALRTKESFGCVLHETKSE